MRLACPGNVSTVTTYMSVPCRHRFRNFHGNYVNKCAQPPSIAEHQQTILADKLCLCVLQRYMAECRYNFTHSQFWYQMKLAASLLIPTEQDTGWAPELGWILWRNKKNFLCLTEIEIYFLNSPAHSIVTITVPCIQQQVPNSE